MTLPTNASRRIMALLAAGALTACSGSSDDGDAASAVATTAASSTSVVDTTQPGSDTTLDMSESSTAPQPRTIEHQYGSTDVPADPQRVVALSEEFLLADLLALGVTPIASTSNDADGFLGVDPAASSGIANISSADFNIEQLASLQPDLIVAYPSYIDLVGYDLLDAIAPTVAIGTVDSDWRERLELTAATFGRESAGAGLADDVEAQLDAARTVLDGRQMSVASISPGPFIRAFTDNRTALTRVMSDLGVVFVPDGGDTDDNGRIEISLERLGELDAPILVLLQASFIDGVDDALASVEASPLWPTLPAVQADAVIELDQLAYFGAEGVGAFASDLAGAVEATR